MAEITVVVPLYNKQESVARCLKSVLRQRYRDFSLVIVDDGSTDKSFDVANGFQDDRITILRQTNAGVSAARNAGVEAANTPYVCFLDADDEWHEDFLSNIAALIEENRDAAIYSTRHVVIDEVGRDTLGSLFLSSDHFGSVDNFYEVYRKSQSFINSSSVCLNRAALRSIGGFPIGKAVGEDVFVWLRLAEASRAVFCGKILSIAHHDAENRTNVRQPGKIPFYIEYYLEDPSGVYSLKGDRSLKKFISHYSLIYAMEAVRCSDFDLARYYSRAWRNLSLPVSATIAIVSILPPSVPQLLRDARRAIARMRGKGLSHIGVSK